MYLLLIFSDDKAQLRVPLSIRKWRNSGLEKNLFFQFAILTSSTQILLALGKS